MESSAMTNFRNSLLIFLDKGTFRWKEIDDIKSVDDNPFYTRHSLSEVRYYQLTYEWLAISKKNY